MGLKALYTDHSLFGFSDAFINFNNHSFNSNYQKKILKLKHNIIQWIFKIK